MGAAPFWKRAWWVLTEEPKLKALYRNLKDRPDLFTPGCSACLGCPAELGLRFVLRNLGPQTILAIPPSCMGGVGAVGVGETSGCRIPVFFPLLDNIAAMMSGIQRHFRRRGRKVNVVCYAGDGGTADAGFQCLSAASERGERLIYICYDNEGYMNTGVQRSGTTPLGAWTTTTPVGRAGSSSHYRGKGQPAKDLPVIMAAHRIPYVATASTAFLPDFAVKLKKAAEIPEGVAYIHLFSPCPTGWRFPTDRSIEVSRAAVESGFFPLWEAVRGKVKFTHHPIFARPMDEFLKMIGKYEHLSEAEAGRIKELAAERRKYLEAMSRV